MAPLASTCKLFRQHCPPATEKPHNKNLMRTIKRLTGWRAFAIGVLLQRPEKARASEEAPQHSSIPQGLNMAAIITIYPQLKKSDKATIPSADLNGVTIAIIRQASFKLFDRWQESYELFG